MIDVLKGQSRQYDPLLPDVSCTAHCEAHCHEIRLRITGRKYVKPRRTTKGARWSSMPPTAVLTVAETMSRTIRNRIAAMRARLLKKRAA